MEPVIVPLQLSFATGGVTCRIEGTVTSGKAVSAGTGAVTSSMITSWFCETLLPFPSSYFQVMECVPCVEKLLGPVVVAVIVPLQLSTATGGKTFVAHCDVITGKSAITGTGGARSFTITD